MPAVPPSLRRRQVLVEVQESGAGDVRLFVFRAPAGGIGEVVPAVEHHPIGIGKLPREDFGADERGEDHAAILSRGASYSITDASNATGFPPSSLSLLPQAGEGHERLPSPRSGEGSGVRSRE